MGIADPTSLLSGRAQDRLSQLHRTLCAELRSLANQQSMLLGALQACDRATQIALLHDYLLRVEAILLAADRLRTFLARHAEPQEVRAGSIVSGSLDLEEAQIGGP